MVKIGGNLGIKIARHLNLGQNNLSIKYIQYNIWGGKECLVIVSDCIGYLKANVI